MAPSDPADVQISRSRHRRRRPEHTSIRRADLAGQIREAELSILGGQVAGASRRGSVQADAGRRSRSVPRRDARPFVDRPRQLDHRQRPLARPGVDEIMLDLLYDIRNNRHTVADALQLSKAHQHQVMNATGVNDPLFPGASMASRGYAGDPVSPDRQRPLRAGRPLCRHRATNTQLPDTGDAGLKH